MKKFLAIVMCLAMALSMMTVVSFAANFDIELVADTVTAKAGEPISIDITMSGNQGISYMKLKATYDKTALTLDSIDDGGLFESSMHNPKSGSMTWTCGEDYSDDGVVATLNFTVLETAAAGEYPIKVTVSDGPYAVDASVEIGATITNGKIVVEADEPEASAEIINVPGEIGPNDGVVKVLQVVGAPTEFGIKYVGGNTTYYGETFKSLAPAGSANAAVEVVGLDDKFEPYFVK